MRINTNLNAMTALNNSTKTTALAGNSMEKLSSGLRINKAGDDAAGLAISEKMRSQIRGMEQASRNTQDGVSLVQTAEGAMEEIGNITQRMRELSVQASNGTNTDEDRVKIQAEITQLTEQIDNITESTKFNGQQLLNGGGNALTADDTLLADGVSVEFSKDLGVGATISMAQNENELTITVTKANGDEVNQTVDISALRKDRTEDASGDLTTTGTINFDAVGIKINVKDLDDDTLAALEGTIASNEGSKNVNIQTGANNSSAESIAITIQKTDTTTLGINTIDVSTEKGAKDAIDAIDGALAKINTSRANLGAMQNRLEYTDSNLTTSTENLTAAESRIRDVDVAAEMMNLSKLNLINQASQAMMMQAKSQPEGVMQILR